MPHIRKPWIPIQESLNLLEQRCGLVRRQEALSISITPALWSLRELSVLLGTAAGVCRSCKRSHLHRFPLSGDFAAALRAPSLPAGCGAQQSRSTLPRRRRSAGIRRVCALAAAARASYGFARGCPCFPTQVKVCSFSPAACSPVSKITDCNPPVTALTNVSVLGARRI